MVRIGNINMNLNSAFGANSANPSGLQGFDFVEPAPEISPLPAGIYLARVLHGELTVTKTSGVDAYRIRFEVIEGEHSGRTLIRTWTFGEKAVSYTKRDLAVFGLTTMAQLRAEFPVPGKQSNVRLKVVLKRGDDGHEFNDIKRIQIVNVIDSPAARFRLPEIDEGGPT